MRGTLPADDPLNRATVQAVQDELTEDGYVYRFRHDARPLPRSEGAFLLPAQAFVHAGMLESAIRLSAAPS
jgi:GH15 family glucan-1,4-alpha-glucosidase